MALLYGATERSFGKRRLCCTIEFRDPKGMFTQPVIDRDLERISHDLELLGQFDDSSARTASQRRGDARRRMPRLFVHRVNVLAGTR